MATIQMLRANLERDIAQLDAQIETDKREIRSILNAAESRGATALNLADDARAEALMASAEAAKAARARKADALSRAFEIENEETEQEKRLLNTHRTTAARPNSRTTSLSVGRNERVYRPDTDPNGRNFLLDVARSAIFNDRGANSRLDRHMEEERVERPGYAERALGDLTTGVLGGLVVPQFLTDLYAPALANMRPLANAVNRHTLPAQGMSLTLPMITTATSAALQASQLTAVSATSLQETDLSLSVLTAAGSQNVSRQAIERGTGIDDITAQDLFKRVATVIDSTLINQAATGLTNVAQVVTYTSGTPTASEFYPYIFQAESKLEAALLAQARVDTVVMAPRRWNWMCSQVGSTYPFLQDVNFPGAAQNNAIQVTNEYGPSYRGVLSNGLKVCVDNNVPQGAAEEVYVLASEEVHLWEDPSQPMLIRAEQANAAALGVLLVAYSYFAFTAKRYSSNPAKISGTGLAAPAGF